MGRLQGVTYFPQEPDLSTNAFLPSRVVYRHLQWGRWLWSENWKVNRKKEKDLSLNYLIFKDLKDSIHQDKP